MAHFLFIGSDESLADELQMALSALPTLTLHVVSSLAKAQQILSGDDYALIFLQEELISPEFIEMQRHSEAAVPVIGLLSSNDSVSSERILSLGAVDSLSRSRIDAEHVTSAVRSALAQRELWLSLRAAEQRHEILLRNSSQGVWRFDLVPPVALDQSPEEIVRLILAGARLVECNDAKAQMYGFESASTIHGTWLSDAMVGNESAIYDFLLKFVLSQFQLRETELMELDRNGQPKYFLQNVTGIIQNGHLAGMWGAQTDITTAKNSETTQAHLNSIIESSHEAIYTVSLDGVLLSWNQGAQEILGYSSEEAIGQSLHLLVPPHLVSEARSILEKIRRGQRVPTYETQRRHKDGSLRDISLSVSPIVDSQNNVVGMWALGRDTTESRRAEEEVRRSEKLYHSLASNFPNGSVYLLDLNERFLLAEGQGLSTVGLEREKIVGKTITEVFGATPIGVQLTDCYAKALAGAGTTEEVEFNGQYRRVQIIPIRDDGGEVTHILAMTQDVTEQHQARIALERSERLYSTLVKNFPNGAVLLFDCNMRYLLAGGRGLAQIGLDAQQMIGKTPDEAFPNVLGAQTAKALFERVLKGEEFDAEVTFGDHHRWVHAVPIYEGEQISGGILMSQDITEQKRARLALEHSEKLYSTLVSNFPNGSVVLFDRDMRCLLAGGRGLAQIGVEAKQLIGKTIHEALGDSFDPEQAEALFNNTLLGKEFSGEINLGSRYRRLHAVPIFENEQVCNVMMMSQDITDRKQAEQALRESEELNRAVLDSMLANIVVLDATGTITAVNEPWRQFARENGPEGESLPSDGIGMNYLDVCAQSMSNSSDDSMTVAQGIRDVLEGRLTSFTLEYSCHCPDQQRWFQMIVTPLATAKGGVVVAHIPITEQRLAEHALRASEERLRAFLDNIPASVFIKDEGGHYLYLNKSCETLMQKPVADLLGKTAFDHYPLEVAHQIHEISSQVMQSGQALETEYSDPTAQGGPRHHLVVRFPLSEPDGKRLLAGVAIDITERKRIEEELRRSQEQLTLAQSIAHLGHVQHDLITDKIFWSDEIYRIYGLEPQSGDANYQRFLEIIHPEDRHILPSSLDQFRVGPEANESQFRIMRPNGEVRWVRGKAQLSQDAQGSITGVMATVLDITDLKKVQDERDRFFELSPDMMVISDTSGYFKRVNPAWSEVLGYTPEEMVVAPFIDFVHPEDREATLNEASQIYAGGTALRFENRYRCRDGSYKLLQWNTTYDPTTELIYSVATDVTQRRKDETELLESRNRLASVINSALDAIITVDAQNRIIEFNPAAESIFGYSRDQVLERDLSETIIPPAFRDAHNAGMARFLSTKRARILNTRLELTAIRATAEEFPIELSATAFSENGEFTFTAFIRDITQRKQAEAELRESEARFRSMADTAPVLIWMSDITRACTYLNDTWQKFTGRSLKEDLGNGWSEGIHPDDVNNCLDIYRRSFEARQPFEMEYRLKRHDGVYRWLLDQGVPRFSPDGLFLGYIGTCMDIDDVKRAHVELAQSQQRLSAIVSSAMDAIITTDASMQILLFNPAAERMFGYKAGEVLGQSINRLIPTRYRDGHPEHVANFGKTGMTARRMGALGAVSGMRANGEEFPIEASISQIQLDDQKLFTVILRDITEREQAESELRSSQERLEVAVQSGRIGLWEWNAATNSATSSGYYKKQLGYEDEEFDHLSETFAERLHPEDRDRVLKSREALQHGGGSAFQDEFRLRRKDGSYRWILSQGTVFRDSAGNVERILGSHIDITSLKESEEELFRSREALQRAHDDLERRVEERTLALQDAIEQLEQARDATEQANAELRINEARLLHGNRVFTDLTKLRVDTQTQLEDALRAVTQAGCEVLDLDRCSIWLYNEDETSIRCLDLFQRATGQHSQGLELFVDDYPNYFRALQSKESIVADDAHSHPATRDFSVSYLIPLNISSMLDVPIVISGQMIGVVCCEQVGERRQWKVEDRTAASSLAGISSLALESLERARAEADLRQAKNEAELAREEAEYANQAKSEFLSRMSHELRTPMNSILGFAQILQMNLSDERHLQRVDLILKAGRHLLQLINEVLDVARVESGHISLSPEPVMVESVVHMAVDMVRPLYQQLHLNFAMDIETCHQVHVWADQQRLSQVLLNLLSNAGKYNRDGGKVTVWCEQRGKVLRLSVSDTGAGIAPHLLQKVFQPFERLGREGSSIEGTGLGLTLSKRLIEVMGGRMGVESEVEVGSTFWIELPLSHSPLQQIIEATSVDYPHAPPSQKHTILYIEDNFANLQVLEHLLADDPNINLISAVQGQMGLELARQHLPALILLDLHLPDILGDEVLKRVLAEPELRDIPVIMLSADATPSQITRLLAAGAAEYLTKPLDMHLLLSVLYKFLEERSP